MSNKLTLDYLYCKEHFDKLTSSKENKWLIKELDRGFTDFDVDKCELKKCNKKGYAIVQEKDIEGNGNFVIIGCIKFSDEIKFCNVCGMDTDHLDGNCMWKHKNEKVEK